MSFMLILLTCGLPPGEAILTSLAALSLRGDSLGLEFTRSTSHESVTLVLAAPPGNLLGAMRGAGDSAACLVSAAECDP